jgi:metal-responsive CopG/Arc/MetJ family transcriptional regulator
MRTIIDLPDAHRDALDALSQRLGISRAEAVRRAVAEFLQAHRDDAGSGLFGIWRDRGEDALAVEDRIRDEWARR